MIDFHSHILPNIDDGSINVEETMNMLKEAKQAGFTKIISTSHYIREYYESNESERMQLLNIIKENYKDIEFYLGSEIYITDDMVQLLKDGKASTINNSRYVLFELPMNSKSMRAKETVYRLIENGYIPIIAHPERYTYAQEDFEYIEELAQMGALFQGNYGSIIGLYGKKAEKTLKRLLREDLIHFLGSDAHRTKQIYPKIGKAIKKISKIISENKFKELAIVNPQKVLDNESIEN